MSSGPSPGPDVLETDLSGRQLGDYQILRRLGRGGMAEVYLAEQGSLRRQVAFKVLKPNLAGDEAYVRRFRHEAQAAAALAHANIVQIYEVGCLEGVHFIAQEYLKGQNLRQLLSRQSSLSAPVAISILRQVAAALHRAGQQGIIHRDIKPENILIAPNGEVKVADFGLARVLQNNEALNLTQVGMTMGTPLYMSPEQVEGKPVDQRSDLYSLGVTSYHMLVGRPPFTGETPLSIAVQHLKTEPDRLEELRPDLPPGLCRIVHKLMAKAPDQRFASAADLLRELRTLRPTEEEAESWTWFDEELAIQPSPAHAATEQLQTLMLTESRLRRRASNRFWWPIALVLALALGAVAAWATRPEPLLAVKGNSPPGIARQDSAESQFIFAVTSPVPSEAAYRAVWEYFPENQYYGRRAKQHLARLYYDRSDLASAETLYQELTEVEAEELQFRIIGHLGLANIASARKDQTGTVHQLSQAAALIAQIPADRRTELLTTLDEALRAEWQRASRDFR